MNSSYKQNIEFQHNIFAQVRKRKATEAIRLYVLNHHTVVMWQVILLKKIFLIVRQINSTRFSTETMSRTLTVQCQIFPAQ